MFSVMKIGRCLRPSWMANVSPTKSGSTIEREALLAELNKRDDEENEQERRDRAIAAYEKASSFSKEDLDKDMEEVDAELEERGAEYDAYLNFELNVGKGTAYAKKTETQDADAVAKAHVTQESEVEVAETTEQSAETSGFDVEAPNNTEESENRAEAAETAEQSAETYGLDAGTDDHEDSEQLKQQSFESTGETEEERLERLLKGED